MSGLHSYLRLLMYKIQTTFLLIENLRFVDLLADWKQLIQGIAVRMDDRVAADGNLSHNAPYKISFYQGIHHER